MDDLEHEINITVDHPTLIQFYKTIAKAYRNWPGGEAYEQEILLHLKRELWKSIMEAQFLDKG